jgi:hypothetical protein
MEDIRSNKRAERSTGGLSGVCEREVLADGRLLRVLESDGRERLNSKVGSLGAGLDELSSQGEDSTGLKGGIESSGDGLSTCGDSDEGLVASLNGDDGGSRGEHIRRVDKGRSSKVGGDTDGFQNTGSLDHGIGAGQSSVEPVAAMAEIRVET